MIALQAITGARIFTGEHMLDEHAVLIEDGRITAVVPGTEILPEVTVHQLGGGFLVPGFIDVQVNGGGGVLFNATPDVASLARMAAAHARFGTTAMLPTFITDRPEGMRAAVAAVRQAIDLQLPGIIGLHLEGPYIAPTRKGAHAADLIRPMTEADLAFLIETGLTTLVVTIAPDVVSTAAIARLADNGVIVSLGHTEATYTQMRLASQAGARGVTHLYNAMSPLMGRDPGAVGAALDLGDLWVGIIADGHHVDPAALALAIRAKRGPGKLLLVTDAMPTAGDPADVFELNGRRVTRTAGRLTLDDGTLAGSNLTMDAALRFAVAHLDVGLDEALRMASLYPAGFLGISDTHGRIHAGYRADLVHLSDDLDVRDVWIAGRLQTR